MNSSTSLPPSLLSSLDRTPVRAKASNKPRRNRWFAIYTETAKEHHHQSLSIRYIILEHRVPSIDPKAKVTASELPHSPIRRQSSLAHPYPRPSSSQILYSDALRGVGAQSSPLFILSISRALSSHFLEASWRSPGKGSCRHPEVISSHWFISIGQVEYWHLRPNEQN